MQATDGVTRYYLACRGCIEQQANDRRIDSLRTAGRSTRNQIGQCVVLQGVGAGSYVHADQFGSPGGFQGLVQKVSNGVAADQIDASAQGVNAIDKLVGIVRIRCSLDAGSRGGAANQVVA